MSTRAEPLGSDRLLGRAADLTTLGRFLGGLGSGGGALLLSGVPGVGKTALLDWAARTAGFDVLRTAGAPYTALGYSALRRPLGSLEGQRRLLRAASRDALAVSLDDATGPPPGLLALSEAILELLRASAVSRPLLFIVDDFQWLDPASSRVLGVVARRLSGSRVGLLGAYRTGQAGFFERSGLAHHEVAPLDPSSAAILLDTRHPDLGDAVRQQVLEQSQGIPLALIELPTALVPAQRSGHIEAPNVLPLTKRLQEIYASSIEALDASTRRLLLIAALDGSEDLRVQLDAARADLDGYSSAEQAGLIQVDVGDGRVSFRHPLIRAAVVDLVTDDERRSAHTALADAARTQPDRRAWHLSEATRYPDEIVAAELELAGRRLLHRGDAVAAVRTLLLAGELTPDAVVRRRRLVQAAYVGADVTGELRSVSALVEPDRSPDPPHSPSLADAVATAYLLLNSEGDVATAHRLLVTAMENRTEFPDDEVRIEALHTLQLICLFGGRPSMWRPFQAALDGLGPRLPLSLWLTSKTFSDPVRTAGSALHGLEEAIGGLQRENDPSQIVRIGMASFYVDRLSGCRHALLRVVRDGRSGGAVASAINALILLSFDDLVTGQWDEAERLGAEALHLCDVHGYRLLSWPAHLALGLLAAARGAGDDARASADAMLDWAAPRGVRLVEQYAHHVREAAALGGGDFELAYQEAAHISPGGSFASHVAHALPVAMDLVEAAVRAGRREEAAAHALAMQEAGIAKLSPRLAFLSAGATALAASPDPPDHAGKLFRHALAMPGATGWPFEYARLQLAFGEHLRVGGETAGARRQLKAALQTFTRLGARPWARRAAVEARAAGQNTPQLLALAPQALTEQEQEVVLLAAAGLTNKQIGHRLFLSNRTVGAHLYRAFPKLGVTSRASLGGALASLPARSQTGPRYDIG